MMFNGSVETPVEGVNDGECVYFVFREEGHGFNKGEDHLSASCRFFSVTSRFLTGKKEQQLSLHVVSDSFQVMSSF